MSLRRNAEKPSSKEASEWSQSMHPDRKALAHLYPSLPSHGVWSAEGDTDPTERFNPTAEEDVTKFNKCPYCADVSVNAYINFLEKQRKQLLSINEKWAKEYRTMVEYYKKKLQNSQMVKQDPLAESKHRMSTDDRNLETKAEGVSADLLKARMEAKALQVENMTLTRKGQQQREEIARLNKVLVMSLPSAQAVNVSSETTEDIWRHQADVYKEDFLRERKDREKLREKYGELEKSFSKTRKELQILKSQGRRNPPNLKVNHQNCAHFQGCIAMSDKRTPQL